MRDTVKFVDRSISAANKLGDSFGYSIRKHSCLAITSIAAILVIIFMGLFSFISGIISGASRK